MLSPSPHRIEPRGARSSGAAADASTRTCATRSSSIGSAARSPSSCSTWPGSRSRSRPSSARPGRSGTARRSRPISTPRGPAASWRSASSGREAAPRSWTSPAARSRPSRSTRGSPLAREEIRRSAGEGAFERGATLLLRDAGGTVTTRPRGRVVEEVALGPGETLRLGFLAGDFFQNNPFILPAFARYVRDQARPSGARFLVDAYCGSGLFTLASAAGVRARRGRRGERVLRRVRAGERGGERDRERHLHRRGRIRDLCRPRVPRRGTPRSSSTRPRKGCDGAFLSQLFDFRPRSVVYVSCDPATQMRDLGGFLAAGYAVRAVQPFDLFPQTRHLECVITLTRG